MARGRNLLSVTLRAALIFGVALGARASFAEELSVQVRSTALRGEPKIWGPKLADLTFGERVEKLSEQASWYRVRTGAGTEGYLQVSALTVKQIVLKGGPQAASKTVADAPDTYLAGKGFNEDIEASFAKDNAKLNFAAVDQLESSSRVDGQALLAFLRDGGLNVE